MIREKTKRKVNSGPLFLPLTSEYFYAFKEGRRNVEYRALSFKWNPDQCFAGRKVTLSRGYGRYGRMKGIIKSVKVIDNSQIPEEDCNFLRETLGEYDFNRNMYIAMTIEIDRENSDDK